MLLIIPFSSDDESTKQDPGSNRTKGKEPLICVPLGQPLIVVYKSQSPLLELICLILPPRRVTRGRGWLLVRRAGGGADRGGRLPHR